MKNHYSEDIYNYDLSREELNDIDEDTLYIQTLKFNTSGKAPTVLNLFGESKVAPELTHKLYYDSFFDIPLDAYPHGYNYHQSYINLSVEMLERDANRQAATLAAFKAEKVMTDMDISEQVAAFINPENLFVIDDYTHLIGRKQASLKMMADFLDPAIGVNQDKLLASFKHS